MKVYASVGEIEGEWAVCEVELVDIQTSKTLSFLDKDTEMCDVSLESIQEIGIVREGDILIVEYEEGNVTTIYGKDDEEKKRRVEILKAM